MFQFCLLLLAFSDYRDQIPPSEVTQIRSGTGSENGRGRSPGGGWSLLRVGPKKELFGNTSQPVGSNPVALLHPRRNSWLGSTWEECPVGLASPALHGTWQVTSTVVP